MYLGYLNYFIGYPADTWMGDMNEHSNITQADGVTEPYHKPQFYRTQTRRGA
jgi:hypothetical protein